MYDIQGFCVNSLYLIRIIPYQIRWQNPSLSDDCLLYTSDAADDLLCVDLGGRRIIKKTNKHKA